jgi:hypothetical protein
VPGWQRQRGFDARHPLRRWAAALQAACGGSQALLPALALLLRRHGGALSASARASALEAVWCCVQSTLSVERAVPVGLEALGTVWALRCLRELAALEAHPDGDAAPDAAEEATPAGSTAPQLSALLRWPEVRAARTRAAPAMCANADARAAACAGTPPHSSLSTCCAGPAPIRATAW